MKSVLPTLVLCLGIIVLWGLWGFFGKLALSRAMPATSVFLAEIATGAIVGVLALALFARNGAILPWQAPVNFWGILSGLVMAIGLLLFYVVLDIGQAVVIVPLTATYPLVTVALSLLFMGERPTTTQWIGLVLVVAGGSLLLTGPVLSTDGAP
ncbi:MAG: EamA family transporter [Alphaproteobacteria bacterium]